MSHAFKTALKTRWTPITIGCLVLLGLSLASKAHAFTSHPEYNPDVPIELVCNQYNQTERRDRDPVRNVGVTIVMDGSHSTAIRRYDVILAMRSGAEIDRSGQYSLIQMYQEAGKLAWTWFGDDGNLHMIGRTWMNDRGWWYSEEQWKNGRWQFRSVFACHDGPHWD
jgi:hypothetical protein